MRSLSAMVTGWLCALIGLGLLRLWRGGGAL
jgi:hypothetical protein